MQQFSTTSIFDRIFEAFLFDMDGTVLNSIAVAERIWGYWARLHQLDVADFLPTIHGKRAAETIAALRLPGIDPEAEAASITDAEIEDVTGVLPIPGALQFLSSLPKGKWAIVTSAPRSLATRRLEAAGLPIPDVLITAEDVIAGKPAPECYLQAARRLSVEVSNCLVFEDAPAGIQAGVTAGAPVLVITETHHTRSDPNHPEVRNYLGLHARPRDGGVSVSQMGASLDT